LDDGVVGAFLVSMAQVAPFSVLTSVVGMLNHGIFRMLEKVVVLPNDPEWADKFAAESRQIMIALGENANAAHHIGSSAIPTIVAKPIVDMLIVVNDIESVDDCNSEMEALGYEVMGEYGIPTRRYFRKTNEMGVRLFHVHVFQDSSPHVNRHLAFRDFMVAHPAWAAEYSNLKQQLAARFPNSMQLYHDGKDEFIKQVDQLAAVWYAARNRSD
jgi:GrpB-like predicted nucleotidyltransferase (UPF0157 family)